MDLFRLGTAIFIVIVLSAVLRLTIMRRRSGDKTPTWERQRSWLVTLLGVGILIVIVVLSTIVGD